MTCLGKWLLASAVLHLLAMAGMAMLCASVQKPVAVIDLSQLGHSCREPAVRQAGGNAQQAPAPTALPRQPAAVTPRPLKQKYVVQPRPAAKSAQPAAQPALADAQGDSVATAAAASGDLAGSGQVRSGSGGTAGNGDGAGTGSQVDYQGMYFGFIKDLVQKAAVYPLLARRMGWQGTVTISFVIQKNGGITDVAVLKSSGHAVLDSSALVAVKKLGPLPCPSEIVEIRLPVVYRLTSADGA